MEVLALLLTAIKLSWSNFGLLWGKHIRQAICARKELRLLKAE
jgi:hypothetical protein